LPHGVHLHLLFMLESTATPVHGRNRLSHRKMSLQSARSRSTDLRLAAGRQLGLQRPGACGKRILY